MDAAIHDCHERPVQVLMADRFSAALLATVTKPMLRGLPLAEPDRYRRLAELYVTN